MKVTDSKLIGARIRFNKGIEELETYAEAGMHARIKSIQLDFEDIFKLTIDYSEFDEDNKALETSNYYDRSGSPCLTAREANMYSVVDTIFVENDKVGTYFDVVDMSDKAQAVDYLQRLLGVTELNLDDMEPETRNVVQEASEWVTKFEV